MSPKRIIALLFIIGGIALLFFSSYIVSQVEEGKEQIATARQQVKRGKSILDLFSATKPIGEQLEKSAERKIAAGQKDIAKYQQLAGQLRIAGFVVIFIGIVLFFWPGQEKTKKRKRTTSSRKR